MELDRQLHDPHSGTAISQAGTSHLFIPDLSPGDVEKALRAAA